ncbi:hypothetical protein JYU34_013318 [Plutella xylostella]|uniref:Uncharacterized protein n=1 Tax=Plutella xylostella TaxID=51655 RepID=A0ABQ7QD67_PLUXY|nr:hypothetical protein JYU34_013318 [Plutella xylostella]
MTASSREPEPSITRFSSTSTLESRVLSRSSVAANELLRSLTSARNRRISSRTALSSSRNRRISSPSSTLNSSVVSFAVELWRPSETTGSGSSRESIPSATGVSTMGAGGWFPDAHPGQTQLGVPSSPPLRQNGWYTVPHLVHFAHLAISARAIYFLQPPHLVIIVRVISLPPR